jgi:anti-sigma factor (TIGR02949 family)
MSCDLEYSVVHSYFDGELSVSRAAEFRHHLAHCSDCMDEFAALSSLRGSLKYARLYETAPASLRLKIRWDLQSVAPTPSWSLPVSWRGLARQSLSFLLF